MNFKRTRAFFNKIRGKKTATGLPINSKGKTPNGTAVNGINKNGRPVTTNINHKTNPNAYGANWTVNSRGEVIPRHSI